MRKRPGVAAMAAGPSSPAARPKEFSAMTAVFHACAALASGRHTGRRTKSPEGKGGVKRESPNRKPPEGFRGGSTDQRHLEAGRAGGPLTSVPQRHVLSQT